MAASRLNQLDTAEIGKLKRGKYWEKMRVLFLTLAFACGLAIPLKVSVNVAGNGSYSLSLDGNTFLTSAPSEVCINGSMAMLEQVLAVPSNGSDAFGAWTGVTLDMANNVSAEVIAQLTFKTYNSLPQTAVFTMTFPSGASGTQCGDTASLRSLFPAWSASGGAASTLGGLNFWGIAVQAIRTGLGASKLITGDVDAGPIVMYALNGEGAPSSTIVMSPLDSVKIVNPSADGTRLAYGLNAAIPTVPVGWSYSVLIVGASGGITDAMYGWGAMLQQYYNTTRVPDTTLRVRSRV
jgi:hypothetical protein